MEFEAVVGRQGFPKSGEHRIFSRKFVESVVVRQAILSGNQSVAFAGLLVKSRKKMEIVEVEVDWSFAGVTEEFAFEQNRENKKPRDRHRLEVGRGFLRGLHENIVFTDG